MLEALVVSNRDAILAAARARVAARRCPAPTDVELKSGIPVFLDQLGVALRLAKSTTRVDHEEIGRSATRHGSDLLQLGLTIGQVVHDYGDVCQSITEIAILHDAVCTAEEFRILNLCLDDAIAAAVTEYARQRELVLALRGTERLGILAHELRNALNTATLAFASLKSGRVSALGSTSLLLGRSLLTLRDLIDRSLAQVRLEATISRSERFSVRELVEELEIGAIAQAQEQGLCFIAACNDATATIQGDRHTISAALGNLLSNAFKFTHPNTTVSLTARVLADRVHFDVEDECGGLPPGQGEELFLPFAQGGHDRTGVGLGLTICLHAAKANGGDLRVRDIPTKGCVFTLELPMEPAASASIASS